MSNRHSADNSPITLLLLAEDTNSAKTIISGFNETCAEAQRQRKGLATLKCPVRVNSVECHDETGTLQRLKQILAEFPSIQGVAVDSKCASNPYLEYIRQLTSKGTAVVTYGRDLPASTGRLAYVGVDDAFLGRTVARLLRQLRPEGGTYAVVGYQAGRTEAFQAEIERYNHLPGRSHWQPLGPTQAAENNLFHQQIQNYSSMDPTAIVTLQQTPMLDSKWTQLVDDHRHRNITYVGVDTEDYQVDYLNRKYVHGLVGQLPYGIGASVFRVLYQNAIRQQDMTSLPKSEHSIIIPADKHIKTSLVSYNIIPLELPALAVDENLLENFAWIGYFFFGLIAVAAVFCIAWTVQNRKHFVVRAAQPVFLVMTAVGVMILAFSLIPLSYDDGGDDNDEHSTFATTVCMSAPWFAFTGFTVIFSALFAKTWRVNQVYHLTISGDRTRRVPVASERDVLAPFAVLLSCNWAILLVWTLWDPLEYIRLEHEGTDYWNREMSTYGVCRSDHALIFLIPLGVLNFAAVLMSCWQAFQARHIIPEFSEATYIGLTVASLGQAFLTGIPVVVLVRDMPRAYYLVLSLIVFLLSVAVLGFIFGPKMFHLHQNLQGSLHSKVVIQQPDNRMPQATMPQQPSPSLPQNDLEESSSAKIDRKCNVMSDDYFCSTDSGSKVESLYGYRRDRVRPIMTSIPEYSETTERDECLQNGEDSNESSTTTPHLLSTANNLLAPPPSLEEKIGQKQSPKGDQAEGGSGCILDKTEGTPRLLSIDKPIHWSAHNLPWTDPNLPALSDITESYYSETELGRRSWNDTLSTLSKTQNATPPLRRSSEQSTDEAPVLPKNSLNKNATQPVRCLSDYEEKSSTASETK